jgi:hypothetical protein
MSLDNTSRPGRPGPDELVPSRYALRIGEIDVMVISDGVVTPPAESMATNADPAVRGAGWTTCSCHGTRSIGR